MSIVRKGGLDNWQGNPHSISRISPKYFRAFREKKSFYLAKFFYPCSGCIDGKVSDHEIEILQWSFFCWL